MKRTLGKGLAMLLTLVCLVCSFIVPIYADTDGTEIQVEQPEKLEIQLGTAWAGVEFQLKTDAGIYPGTVAVGEDGVLRLEIGGSSSYVLSCMNSAVAVPNPDETVPAEEPQQTDAAPEATPDADAQSAESTEPEAERPDTEATPDEAEPQMDEEGRPTVAGIPVMHIVLFGGGLLLAVGGLVAMKIVARRKEANSYEDDDDY